MNQTLPQSLISFTAQEQTQLETLVTTNEGFRQFAYNDENGAKILLQSGNMTIGYGFNLSGVGLSQAESLCILRSRLCLVEYQLRLMPAVDFKNQGQYRKMALIDMSYNLGVTKFATFTDFLPLIRAQKYPEAVADLMQTAWFGEVGIRAARAKILLLTNTWINLS